MKLFMLFMLTPFLVLSQEKCHKYITSQKDPNTEIAVPCKCPSLQGKCKCYEVRYNYKCNPQYCCGGVCVGEKYFSWGWVAWRIDSVFNFVQSSDTVTVYKLSRTTEKYWQIPKELVSSFNEKNWEFQQQDSRWNKRDTIVKINRQFYSTWYFIKRLNNLSIDTVYEGSNFPLKDTAIICTELSKYSDIKKDKCFFFTGYSYGEYISWGSKEMPAMDFVRNWETGELVNGK